MKKILLLLSFFTMGFLNIANAQYNRIVKLFFHSDTSFTPFNINSVYLMVCELNKHYYNENGVPITFYVAELNNQSTDGVGGSNRAGGINIYGGSSLTNSWTGQYIKFDGVDIDALTHEVGHALSLLHPEGNNPVPGCNGDPDCCSDTPIPVDAANPNWMNQGYFSVFRKFTQCQKDRMTSYIDLYLPNPGGSCLNSSANYLVPLAFAKKYGTSASNQYGLLNFSYGTPCATTNVPTSVLVTVRTKCNSGPYTQYSFWVYDLSATYNIDLSRGSTGITLAYYYFGGTSHRHIEYFSFNNPSGGLSCSQPIGAGLQMGIGSIGTEAEIKLYATGKIINYENSTFNKVELYDISGKKVMAKPLEGTSGTIDASSLPDGLYIVKVLKNSNGEYKVVKISIH